MRRRSVSHCPSERLDRLLKTVHPREIAAQACPTAAEHKRFCFITSAWDAPRSELRSPDGEVVSSFLEILHCALFAIRLSRTEFAFPEAAAGSCECRSAHFRRTCVPYLANMCVGSLFGQGAGSYTTSSFKSGAEVSPDSTYPVRCLTVIDVQSMGNYVDEKAQEPGPLRRVFLVHQYLETCSVTTLPSFLGIGVGIDCSSSSVVFRNPCFARILTEPIRMSLPFLVTFASAAVCSLMAQTSDRRGYGS